MNKHHLLTLFTATGILLPTQQATAITAPLPELADGIFLAPKKNKIAISPLPPAPFLHSAQEFFKASG